MYPQVFVDHKQQHTLSYAALVGTLTDSTLMGLSVAVSRAHNR
jgi:hypothetical protein